MVQQRAMYCIVCTNLLYSEEVCNIYRKIIRIFVIHTNFQLVYAFKKRVLLIVVCMIKLSDFLLSKTIF